MERSNYTCEGFINQGFLFHVAEIKEERDKSHKTERERERDKDRRIEKERER